MTKRGTEGGEGPWRSGGYQALGGPVRCPAVHWRSGLRLRKRERCRQLLQRFPVQRPPIAWETEAPMNMARLDRRYRCRRRLPRLR